MRVDSFKVAQEIMGAVSECIPDCDPIDLLVPKLEHMGVARHEISDYLDRACREHLSTDSYTSYLIDAWDGWNEVCEPDQRMTNPWRPA